MCLSEWNVCQEAAVINVMGFNRRQKAFLERYVLCREARGFSLGWFSFKSFLKSVYKLVMGKDEALHYKPGGIQAGVFKGAV